MLFDEDHRHLRIGCEYAAASARGCRPMRAQAPRTVRQEAEPLGCPPARGRSPASAARRLRADCRNCAGARRAGEKDRNPALVSTPRWAAITMFSCTVSDGNISRSCGTNPRPSAGRSCGGRAVISFPASTIFPDRTRVWPMSVESSVVLPTPLRPSSAMPPFSSSETKRHRPRRCRHNPPSARRSAALQPCERCPT